MPLCNMTSLASCMYGLKYFCLLPSEVYFPTEYTVFFFYYTEISRNVTVLHRRFHTTPQKRIRLVFKLLIKIVCRILKEKTKQKPFLLSNVFNILTQKYDNLRLKSVPCMPYLQSPIYICSWKHQPSCNRRWICYRSIVIKQQYPNVFSFHLFVSTNTFVFKCIVDSC